MLTVFVLFLFVPNNWVLATESPKFDDITSTLAPSTGEGGNSDVVLALLLQISRDLTDVKEDVGELKVDQALLQEDVSSLQKSSAVNSAKISKLEGM